MVNECFIKGSERRFYIQRKICDVKNNNFQIKRALSFLQRMTSDVLALYGDNGCPYAVPMSYVYDDDKLFSHSLVVNR